MAYSGSSGFKRLFKAFGYSCQGLAAAWENEQAFRLEVFGGLVLIPLAVWLGESGAERALLIAGVGLVIVVELMNSAIEAVVDRFGGEQHPLSGRAKDIGSAAVLVSLGTLVLIWVCILVN